MSTVVYKARAVPILAGQVTPEITSQPRLGTECSQYTLTTKCLSYTLIHGDVIHSGVIYFLLFISSTLNVMLSYNNWAKSFCI